VCCMGGIDSKGNTVDAKSNFRSLSNAKARVRNAIESSRREC
jgi:hypothetical protein